ncbi:hypothetical protein AUC47_00140 [Microbacterium sp. SZ1]|nr:hypothetical protein AUC47_00140 [Microbacterium sp. SZ1]
MTHEGTYREEAATTECQDPVTVVLIKHTGLRILKPCSYFFQEIVRFIDEDTPRTTLRYEETARPVSVVNRS